MEIEEPPTLRGLFSLAGKVALVTGAGGGLGGAIAEGLASAGASVMLAGLPEERGLTVAYQRLSGLGYPTATVTADLADTSAAPALVEATRERFGALDVLVNCAGINRRQPILDVTPEVYDAIMAVNLRAVYFLCQAAARSMKDHGGGKILNIASLTAAIGLAEVSVYGCTKAAIAELTKTMAVEWAAYDIQVNAIAPGFMRTPLTDALWDHPERQSWMVDRIPARRGGRPEELRGLAVLLASTASSYISGQTIYVDGGFLAGSPW
ncbi:MAG TPA: glucose 1-dehydrogenase [Chloroflexota bacterium]|nr:glucose 1-dehydrogenase [Chloroflexota bacterium]